MRALRIGAPAGGETGFGTEAAEGGEYCRHLARKVSMFMRLFWTCSGHAVGFDLNGCFRLESVYTSLFDHRPLAVLREPIQLTDALAA